MKYYLKLLSIPLLFFGLYTSLFVLWEIFKLPPPEVFSEMVNVWFNKYGMFALLVASFLEGLLLIGSYFPGVFVIFLGVTAASSVFEAIVIVSVSTTGLLLSHVVNYFLGKYGWYKLLVRFGMKEAIQNSKVKLEKKGPIAIPLSYWLPSIGALTNTAAGIIQLNFRTFLMYSVLSSMFWYFITGGVFYLMGDKAFSLVVGGNGVAFVGLIVMVWIMVLVILDRREKKNLVLISKTLKGF